MNSKNTIAGAELTKSMHHIDKLATKHRALDHHWSGLGADPRQSDHLFKHHLTRLRHIYKHHVSHDVTVEPSTALEDRAKLHMLAVTKLYGKDGLLSTANSEQDLVREIGWDDDVGLPSRRNPIGSKVKLMMAQSKAKALGGSQQSLDLGDGSTNALGSTVSIKKTLRKNRCVDFNITEEDVIVLGKYRLNDYQSQVYEEFLHILRGMDPYDVSSMLSDITSEIKELNSLDAYSGIENIV